MPARSDPRSQATQGEYAQLGTSSLLRETETSHPIPLPARAQRRRDRARGAHPRSGRYGGADDIRPALPRRAGDRTGARRNRERQRQHLRSAGGRRLRAAVPQRTIRFRLTRRRVSICHAPPENPGAFYIYLI